MKSTRVSMLTIFAVAVTANIAWGQLIPQVPPVPDVVPDVTNTAKETVQDATNTAKDTVKDATNTTQDAVKDTQDTARDVTNTAQDAAKNAQDTAKDLQRDATKTTRDATRDVQDAARDVQDTARDAQRNAQDATRDATRNARDAARETTDDLRNTARDATRDARDATRDATRDSLDARGNVRARGSVSGRQGSYRGADLGVWFDAGARNGLIIADIAANAALSGVGFREGDRIISVAGRNVATEADFVRYLTTGNVRAPLNVVVMRDGQQQTLVVQPDFLNQQMTTVQLEPLEQFGIIVDDRINDRVVVWRVIPRSPAFYAGIRAGDIITMFANRPVASLAAFTSLALETRAGTVPIQISRNGRTRLVQADFPNLQDSDRHTTFRQNLDANATVTGQVEAEQSIPIIETQPQYYQERTYDNRRQARRAWRRWR